MEVSEIIKAFYQTCAAVKYLHKQNPPIIHRDLKVKNCQSRSDVGLFLNFLLF